MRRILFLILYMLGFILLFVVAKPLFMLYTGDIGQGAVFDDFLNVIWHGLPLDICVAAAATAPVFLGMFISSIVALFKGYDTGYECLSEHARILVRRFYLGYAALLAIAFSLALVSDAALYTFWEIKLDATVLAYLDSPRGVTNSVSALFLFVLFLIFAAVALLVYFEQHLLFRLISNPVKSTIFSKISPAAQRGNFIGFLLLFAVFLIFSIRGINRIFASRADDEPLSVATAYYSTRQIFNHAAVNPVFSFIASVGDKAYGISPDTFMEDAEAARIFASLDYNTKSIIAPNDTLINRPEHVIVIVMEGCGGTLVHGVCGKTKDLTPNLNRLCTEGVFFENCYANSFRTDRGLVCALSGYPSFPDVSVMRQDDKVKKLPGIAASMKKAGYTTDFLYGGDKNFTKMADYLQETGYDHVWGVEDFPENLRHTHEWGVTDKYTFDKLLEICTEKKDKNSTPRFTTFLTLASHEPWEVPYKKMAKKGKIANSFAYLDDCLGNFLTKLKATPEWDKTLIVLIADHGIAWPNAIPESNTDRYHIPMIWTGGAIRGARRIPQLCNQSDLAATLLGQLGYAHNDFTFSRDVMSQTYKNPCAQHSWADGFSFIDNTGKDVIDIHSQNILTDVSTLPSDKILTEKEENANRKARVLKAKAFLQTAYRDFEKK